MTDRPQTALTERIDRLGSVLEATQGLVAQDTISAARGVIDNASARLRHGTEHTVVALAGATGSGKSSLFNAIVGEDVAPTGITRPTTAEAQAAVFGDEDADGLLDWLGVRHRHIVNGGTLDGLVLLDLPDHDSVEITHRMQVDRLVELVDVLIWVLDPQKYADQVLHERYLAPLAKHADVMVFLLHQSDRHTAEELRTMGDDVMRLLVRDGITSPTLLETSVVDGSGVAELVAALADWIVDRTAALDRIDADLLRTVDGLDALRQHKVSQPTKRDHQTLADGLAQAAGAAEVGQVAAAGYRHRARLSTGWPFTRWLGRLRRNPLARLAARDELGAPTSAHIDPVHLDRALKTYADGAAGELDPAWQRRLREVAGSQREELVPAMRHAVTSAVGSGIAPARWWGATGWLQRLFAFVALAGGVWLLALLVLDVLRVPVDWVTPEVQGWPLPTLMLVVGAGLGIALTWITGVIAGVGARRRARGVASEIKDRLQPVAEQFVVKQVNEELGRWARLGDDLDVIAGRV